MKPKVIVDSRESRTKVLRILRDNCDVELLPLACGDYQVSNDVVFERKSYNDFIHSIKDGRLFAQAIELKEAFSQPAIILEGRRDYVSRNYPQPKINRPSLHGALLSVSLGFGIPIIPTDSTVETANLIELAAKRLQKTEEDKKIRTNTRKKPKEIKQQQQFFLESLPGVGPGLAEKIMEVYSGFPLSEIIGCIDDWDVPGLGPKKKDAIKKVLGVIE
jgi:ERCC4-type nuclease